MNLFEKLNALRAFGGERTTIGLPDEVLATFAARDHTLAQAVEDAFAAHKLMREEFPEIVGLDEAAQVAALQDAYVNFYPQDAVNPYVALGAAGPWIVTSKGAVVHDSGGYGMLGFGHSPRAMLEAMDGRQVMANVMTANLSQLRLARALEREVGHTRGGCPFAKFVCLNSGSESVTAAARIVDINAKLMTDPDGRHAGKEIRRLSLKGAFHGRTDRPAQYSDSTRRTYAKHLASFRDTSALVTVPPNDVDALRAAFADAERDGVFIEAMFVEPVMGEGNPGCALERDFYDAARELTSEHGALLLVDSIQAGLRAHGCLSIVDYPGFQDAEAPDMESYSKALNAGQYPLSVLALTDAAASLYRKGVYGNTMTTNPRALDVACAVLGELTDELRANIRERGHEFVQKFERLAAELGGPITSVQGTGLLFSCALDESYKCYGAGSTEEYLRQRGIGVIHGGENSLRFTPHFRVTSEEVDMIVAAVAEALRNGPRRVAPDEEQEWAAAADVGI